MHVSSFAHKLKCPHCGEFHGTGKWPVNGDRIGFYNQIDPGNFSLKIDCPNCKRDWYVVWDINPGQILPLSIVKERKQIHNAQAIKRDIKFEESGEASAQCCWNCYYLSITLEEKHWCAEDMMEVDRRDLCSYWQHR